MDEDSVKEEEMAFYCDVCGESMTSPDDGISYIAMAISMDVGVDAPEQVKEWAAKQMGDYEIGRSYYVCFTCLLKALGVKP